MGKVLIGGGSGFIGNALKNLLDSKGYKTIIISRKPGRDKISWNDLVSSGLPSHTTAVVNLAGQNVLDPFRRWTPGFRQNVWSSRVCTTSYLAKAIDAADVKPEVFISSSGAGFYEYSETAQYDETSEGGDFDFLSRLCQGWENAAKLEASPEVRSVTFRLGVVLGRQGGMIQRLFLPFYFGGGGRIGSGKQFMPWIHINDVAALYCYAIENNAMSGVVNAVAPQVITNAEFTNAFGRAMWRPTVIPVPPFILNILFSRERARMMVEGQNVVSIKLENAGFQFQYPKIGLACKEFSHLFSKKK